jgi:hypothetical protein
MRPFACPDQTGCSPAINFGFILRQYLTGTDELLEMRFYQLA